MTVLLVAVASILVFLAAFARLQVVERARESIALSQQAVQVIKDPSLSDLEQEKLVQKASVGLLKLFASILLRSAASVAAAALPVFVADAVGLVSADAVVSFLSRWDVIVVSSVLIVALFVIWHRMQKGR